MDTSEGRKRDFLSLVRKCARCGKNDPLTENRSIIKNKMMEDMDMDGFCWMCASMWVGAIVVAILLVLLLFYVVKWKKKK